MQVADQGNQPKQDDGKSKDLDSRFLGLRKMALDADSPARLGDVMIMDRAIVAGTPLPALGVWDTRNYANAVWRWARNPVCPNCGLVIASPADASVVLDGSVIHKRGCPKPDGKAL